DHRRVDVVLDRAGVADNWQTPQLALAGVGGEVALPELLQVVASPLLVALIERVEIMQDAFELKLGDQRRDIDPNGIANLAGGRERQLFGVHLGAWEPLALDLDVRMVGLELGDEGVVPVALLARVALDPVVVADHYPLTSRGRFRRGLR